MRRLIICLILPLFLAACGAEPTWAPDDAVRKATFASGEAPSITLYTVISKNTGAGGHSSLLVDGTQRVLFDPAGTFQYPLAPERNDVHFGMTERMRKLYIDYHAREDWFVREQKIYVSLETAEDLRRRVQAYGAVSKSMCANSISSVLSQRRALKVSRTPISPLRFRMNSQRFRALHRAISSTAIRVSHMTSNLCRSRKKTPESSLTAKPAAEEAHRADRGCDPCGWRSPAIGRRG